MSQFTNNNAIKIESLLELSEVIINKQKPAKYVKEHMDTIDAIMPSDVVSMAHLLVEKGYPMDELKKHIAKLLNLFYKALSNFDTPKPKKDSFLYYLVQSNSILEEKLQELKIPIKEINKIGVSPELLQQVEVSVESIKPYIQYFSIKENLLFPIIEKHWDDYKCVQIMWSIHDDIRSYMKQLSSLLNTDNFDLKQFNIITSKLYFDLKAIRFRDENILFPQMLLSIPDEEMDKINHEITDFEIPFVKIEEKKIQPKTENNFNIKGDVDLGTGSMSAEQIMLIFNHLPVDITYVDENNKVKYYSTPKHRIFPRTNAIIGREVQNCHPPESVHVVEKIVDAFRNGEKNDASFWIPMGPKFVLIKYFAVRDVNGVFRGTLEVSQEISDIKALEGEKRLLDWDE
jgi:DUF438 domain-containing protein